jgi:Xaa-Pro aminopeptidase
MPETRETSVRLSQLERLLESEGLHGLVACSYENLCYFAATDLRSQLLLPQRLAFLVAVRNAPASLLVCNIEESQARRQSPVKSVHSYVEFAQDPATELASLLLASGLSKGRVGIEAHRLPAGAFRTLMAVIPQVEWVPIDAQLDQLTTSKDPGEIDTLGSLARSLLDALAGTIGALGAEGSELDYSAEMVKRITECGALPLFLFFASGERTVLGHPEPVRSPLREGAVWRTDFGARLAGGLSADVARTGVVGTASARQEEVFAGVRAAQDAVAALAEPGRPASDLFFACRDSFEASKLPFTMPHVGHGIGVGLHESPILEPGNDDPLRAGTVLCIEPFAVFKEEGEAYHTEDVVAVTIEGPKRLTRPQDSLVTIA